MEDEDILKMLGDRIRTAQADAIAAKHVVRELLVDVARLQSSPERYTTELCDRVIARLEPEGGRPQKTVMGLARDMVGALFRDVLQAIRDS